MVSRGGGWIKGIRLVGARCGTSRCIVVSGEACAGSAQEGYSRVLGQPYTDEISLTGSQSWPSSNSGHHRFVCLAEMAGILEISDSRAGDVPDNHGPNKKGS